MSETALSEGRTRIGSCCVGNDRVMKMTKEKNTNRLTPVFILTLLTNLSRTILVFSLLFLRFFIRSRLGCQVIVTPDMDGIVVSAPTTGSRRFFFLVPVYFMIFLLLHVLRCYIGHNETQQPAFVYRIVFDLNIFYAPAAPQVKLPPATRNFYVDGHVPQPH